MAETRPNILIFMTDQQQGATALPQHPCRLPHVERLAAAGVTFTDTYCPSPHCCPSRATFMSGLYPSRHGIDNNVATDTALGINLRDGVRLFSEGLAASGYRLGYSGKWHVSRDIMPADRGWTDYGSGPLRGQFSTSRQPANWERAHRELTAPEPRQPGWVQRPGWGNIRVYGSVPDGGPRGYEGTADHRVVTRAIDGLRQLAAGEDPWCLYVGTGGPHDPYIVPETFARMYAPADIALPPSFSDDLADKPRVYQRMRYQYWGQLTEDEVRASLAHYWGYCSMMDALFGLLLEELERTGQADHTVVLFCSDHGD
ncbi:MAG: sulfatase-like hydrolase/transferase [Fimbriimonadaceae bacterium]|nr:sulfatase-like hydrolase/transferase [Fimbriimonadaceae bacterium]